MSTIIANNVVDKDTLRKIQIKVLNELSDILKLSFGPNGSNACIKKENALSRYTKDGHTIIGSLHYNGIIEQSIKDDIESITRHIVKTVGDGTTSAVLMARFILENIIGLEENTNYRPNEIMKTLQKCVDEIKEKIKESGREFTSHDAYDIAMISTNGNETISRNLEVIYEKFGSGVFIDVTPSIGEETIIKSYDGMTINSGYCDSCYVTTKDNTSEVDNPDVYFFEHPIDTRELGVYLDSIISRNIITPVNTQKFETLVPTVIFAPKISQDMSSIMDSLVSTMANMPLGNKLPICIITDLIDTDELSDLANMCGAKMIRKYIDANVFKEDVEAGRAPTPETVFNWAGHCDKVISYSDKTTFIRPNQMYNDNNEYSDKYYNLLNYLENESKKYMESGDTHLANKFKRRLHSLKSNMVELFVGGITQADRDSLCDLVEDAVLNIRSAAQNGVGYGANMSGATISDQFLTEVVKNNNDRTHLENEIFTIIANSYGELISELFYDGNGSAEQIIDLLDKCNSEGLIYNIAEEKFDTNVISSIQSDITILDTVCKIVGIMATCNQFILPSAMHNIYTVPTD